MMTRTNLLNLFTALFFTLPQISNAAIEKVDATIDSHFGEKLKEEKSISLVVLSLVGPDVFAEIESKKIKNDEALRRDYEVLFTANGRTVFDGTISYESMGGPQKWLSFKTKDRYIYFHFAFPEIDREFSGVVDMRKVSTIEIRLVDEEFNVSTFSGGRTYE